MELGVGNLTCFPRHPFNSFMLQRARVFGISALLLLAGCGLQSEESTEAVQVLPNSLSDTSAHVAGQTIPRYRPDAAVDTSRGTAVNGQVLYVPVYSHIFQRTRDHEFALTATLSIRNVSTTESITIRTVDYFNSEGELLRSYLEGPRTLGPLSSTYVVIAEEDRSGGVGANFIVRWNGGQPVTPPLVETIMISTVNTQGLSFTSRARVLQQW